MKIIEVKDMDIKIDLSNPVTCVIGPSNSGKTILAKRLCNKIDNSSVFIDGESIASYDYDFLRRNIVVVLDDNNFICETVNDELSYYLSILDYNSQEITKRIDAMAKYFKIKRLLDKNISDLYLSDKILVKILSLLIIDPTIIVIDNIISYLSIENRELLFKYIKSNNKNLINLTTNPEQVLISDNVVVINNFKKVIAGSYEDILKGNSILPYMGLKLPFIVDLSNNLILYNVIDKIYYDYRKLVNKLWK
ncbi:MAG: ATP-binding cassette domain-containing protein [Erysipelotrichales bacterium]|nr:ATP-binding cassette domain-containing protein [Erysipelotrichales bacterium]